MRLLASIAFAAIAGAIPAASAQQAYPAKPIRIIITFPPGGATDIVGRLLTAKMQESVGQPFLIENKSGANGNIGADFVAKSPPDGYTLLHADLSTFAIGPAIYPKLPFDPIGDFAPVSMLVVSPYPLALNTALPFKTLQEVVAHAKANPGKLNYAHLGNGSASHLAAVEFGARTGTTSTFVPYKGGAPALSDVASGQADMLSIAMISTQAFARSGKLRLVALMGANRSPLFPDVPTMTELGYPGFIAGQFQALYAPKGTPPEIIAKLNAEVHKAIKSPEVSKRLNDVGAEVIPGTPESLAKFVLEEKERWAKVVRDHNVRAD